MSSVDPLLSRQLTLLGLQTLEAAPSAGAWRQVLEWVSVHYREMAEERRLLRDALEHQLHELVDRLEAERARRDELLARLRAAGDVQRAWSPVAAVTYPGATLAGHCEAAAQCGGDFWASWAIDDHRVLIAIGDATGHGPDAAIMTGVAKGVCDVVVRSAHPRSSVTCSSLLAALNRSIYDAAPAGMSMTFAVGILDQHAGTVTVASAGHPLPYVLRGGALDHIAVRGAALGADPGSRYAEATALLGDGDMVFWHTDGLVEAEDADRRQLGHRRLRRVLSRAELVDPVAVRDAVAEELRRFRGGADAQDDVAFVVAQRRSGS
jgi:serine phosphatase RsbU (regulator of sigma subunit)